MPPLLVFDLDGTLVDSVGDIATALNESLSFLVPGTPPLPFAAVRDYVGEGATRLLEKAIAHAGLTLSSADTMPVFLERYERHLTDTTRPYRGIPEALESLLSLWPAAQMAILTNKPARLARASCDRLGLTRFFARVWGPEDVPGRKPHPDGLRQLMAELATSPECTVMIGDSPIDIRTGRGAGTHTVGVLWGLRPDELPAESPGAICTAPRDLPQTIGALVC